VTVDGVGEAGDERALPSLEAVDFVRISLMGVSVGESFVGEPIEDDFELGVPPDEETFIFSAEMSSFASSTSIIIGASISFVRPPTVVRAGVELWKLLDRDQLCRGGGDKEDGCELTGAIGILGLRVVVIGRDATEDWIRSALVRPDAPSDLDRPSRTLNLVPSFLEFDEDRVRRDPNPEGWGKGVLGAVPAMLLLLIAL